MNATEAHRHECEVRHVADMKTNALRKIHLEGVQKHRSAAEVDRLRKDAWALLRQRKALMRATWGETPEASA